MVPEPTNKTTRTHPNGQPLRLVKAWLPVDLVRRLDRTILDSNGAYADRTEFLIEAINDRLDEDANVESAADISDPRANKAQATPIAHETYEVANGRLTDAEVESVQFGDWLDADSEPPTLPTAEGPAFNFGLHNRDLPTLWAFDWLCRLVLRLGEPIAWAEFEAEILPRAWAMGRVLRQRDLSGDHPIKLVAGFPTNLKKREATERRFMAHFVTALSGSGPTGPLFVFRMIGSEKTRDELRLAPSLSGLEVFKALIGADLSTFTPFPQEAWLVFASHLRGRAPEELQGWLRVMGLVAEQPTRDELVKRCDWWSGSAADTNTMSYVARGREWGLVEPKLDSGRYRLTAFGQEIVQGEEKS